jgi:hypothetical protein
MNSKELADKVEAEERLKARGWIKELCLSCRGKGLLMNQYGELIKCPTCRGEGGEWNEATPTLGSELPKEISRCVDLIADYAAMRDEGLFAMNVTKQKVNVALDAIGRGDTVAMIAAYKALKECE